jgi:PIN domain nuclease of toxin-antitoxin system
MNVLLDTSVFLWCIAGQQSKLSRKAARVVEDPATRLWLSVASLWEIVLMVRAGKLVLPQRADFFQAHMAQLGVARVLTIDATHVLADFLLPPHHRDPFDRLLIAQAQVERVPLVTGDARIREYAIQVVW